MAEPELDIWLRRTENETNQSLGTQSKSDQSPQGRVKKPRGVKESVQRPRQHGQDNQSDDGSEDDRGRFREAQHSRPDTVKVSPQKNQRRILITGDHPDRGKVFEIKAFKPDGWVLTADNHLFHEEFFECLPNLTSAQGSAQSLGRSHPSSPNSSPLKTSQDSSVAPSSPATPLGHISAIFSGRYNRAGTMRNGYVSVQDTLPPPSVENGYCWLESPNALSSTGKGRPPGQSRLEADLKQKQVIKRGECLNPTWLEAWFNLPQGWTNPSESRAAMELIETAGQPSETASTPEWQRSPFIEFSICPSCASQTINLNKGCGICGWISPKKKSGETQSVSEARRRHRPSPKSPKKNPSGYIGPVVQRKRGKDGRMTEYPKVVGERVPLDLAWEYPHQFIWLYNWSVKDADGCWKTKSKSVPRNRIWTIRSAIAANKPVEEILKLIEQP